MPNASTMTSSHSSYSILTVDQLYDWNRAHSPETPAFIYVREEDGNGKKHKAIITWKELGEGIDRARKIIQKLIPETQEKANISEKKDPIVICILTTSGKRPILPFPLSTRNSPAAIAHLIRTTGAKYVLCSEGPMQTSIDEAMVQGGLDRATILQVPTFSQLYLAGESADNNSDEYDYSAVPLDSPALVLHSSGSTAFPKPQTLTHRILIEWSGLRDKPNGLGARGETMAVHSSPLFHAIGILSTVWAPVWGFVRAVPSPHGVNPPITPESFLEQIVESQSSILLCVPSFLEAWSKESQSIETLRKLKAILWAGGPLKPDVGQLLYRKGVPISTIYGATELGLVSFVPDKPHPEGYEWFRFATHTIPKLIPEDEEGVFELAFEEQEKHHLTAVNGEIDSHPVYFTNDLVKKHPTHPELFRIWGRKDDQIILSTGEKTNPGPLEAIIFRDAHVKSAIIFGRARFQNGILIEPTSFEESEALGLENFRNIVWPSIEKANDYAPAHSRIFKEMILIASPSKPFAYTPKHTLKRASILADYAAEIEAVYKAVQDSSQVDIPIPAGTSEHGGWTADESLDFVRNVVNRIMTDEKGATDDSDLFGLGCDSLQATYIRNSLLHALRQVAPPSNVHSLPLNFVYRHPTVRGLAEYVARVTRPVELIAEVEEEASRARRLEGMISKYTQDWPMHQPLLPKDSESLKGEVILLTGTTGGLGSQILAQLVEMAEISRIYAFNRPSQDGKSSLVRQRQAFLERGNKVDLVDSEKIVYVEGDTAVKGFGIAPDLFNEMRCSVTTIIHNAWRVDFNISLSSFEPAIRGLRNMIDLALGSPRAAPPRVVFTSSVGILKAWTDIPPVQEDALTDIGIINTTGYSESKWVSERILALAAEVTAIKPVIVRVGQLCGGIDGNWNAREWFPALVRASQVVGGVPDNNGLVSFLPLHVAASAMIELRHAPRQFAHLVHPRPVSWRTIIAHIGEVLQVPIIPYDEWLDRLEKSSRTHEALHRNPALHLIEFYQGSKTYKDAGGVSEREAMGLAVCETKWTVRSAPSLGAERLLELDKEEIDIWIKYWKDKGYIDM